MIPWFTTDDCVSEIVLRAKQIAEKISRFWIFRNQGLRTLKYIFSSHHCRSDLLHHNICGVFHLSLRNTYYEVFFFIWDSLLTYTTGVSLHCWLTSGDDHMSMRIESMLLTIHIGKPKQPY